MNRYHGDEHAEIRQLIDDALGSEPQLGLDPDKILHQARRRERRMRFASVSGAFAAVAAVTFGLTLMTTVPASHEVPELVPAVSVEKSTPSSPGPSPSESTKPSDVRTPSSEKPKVLTKRPDLPARSGHPGRLPVPELDASARPGS